MASAGAESTSLSTRREEAGGAGATGGFSASGGLSFSGGLGDGGSTYGGGLRGGKPTCEICTVAGTPAPESFWPISARTRDRKAAGSR